jgi:predicted glycoside hydrolase/deacetylase ChbG (UPF0249 family)
MLIINADDWGASRYITDKIVDCIQRGTVTSVSAMVFMDDSVRAAQLALKKNISTGLHLNLSQPFSSSEIPRDLRDSQERIVSWLRSSKLAQAIYNPFLRKDFAYVFNCQYQEYANLYQKKPSRIDGHNHMHLCANMLVERHIPEGTCVRRNITFVKNEAKNYVNKFIRKQVDKVLVRRYVCTDYFFHVRQIAASGNAICYSILNKVLNLAIHSVIELLVHPGQSADYEFIMRKEFGDYIAHVRRGSFDTFKLER